MSSGNRLVVVPTVSVLAVIKARRHCPNKAVFVFRMREGRAHAWLPFPPSRLPRPGLQARLVGATKGHSLLKKKADALTMEFRKILKKIYAAKLQMGDTMSQSSISMAEAKYAAGESVKNTILDNVDQASVKARRTRARDGRAGRGSAGRETRERDKRDACASGREWGGGQAWPAPPDRGVGGEKAGRTSGRTAVAGPAA